MKSINKEEIDEYKTSAVGVRYCNDTLKAVATVDHKKTEISAYLYAIELFFIFYPFNIKHRVYH